MRHCSEYILGDGEGSIDILLRMREADIAAFEIHGKFVDAPSDKLAPIGYEALDVVAQEIIVAMDRGLQKIEQEDRAKASDGGRYAELLDDGAKPPAQAFTQVEEMNIALWPLQDADSCHRRRDSHRVRVESTREKDLPIWPALIH